MVVNPLEVNVAVLTSEKDPAPLARILAVKVPVEGTCIWSKYPVLAEIDPVVAEERFRIPLTVSIPKVLTYPLIQLSRIKKLELMVILEADIESDPKIVVVVTVAIFLIYLFSTSIFYLSYISMVEMRLKIIISENY
jgi:hypothetical protein